MGAGFLTLESPAGRRGCRPPGLLPGAQGRAGRLQGRWAGSSRADTGARCRRWSAGTSPTSGRSSTRSAPPADALLRSAQLPAHAARVLRGRARLRHRRPGRRRLHLACRPQRRVPHQPAALRPLPASGRRRPLLRRLLPPPVHAGRLALPGAGPAAQRPLHDRDPVQPAHAAPRLPAQALLPHGVRVRHPAQCGVRRIRGDRGGAGADT